MILFYLKMKSSGEVSFILLDGKPKQFLSYQFASHNTQVPEPEIRGVFGQHFDPLVFENFSMFTTKRAKMIVKE